MKSKNKFKYIFISLVSISALYNGLINASQELYENLQQLVERADAYYNLRGSQDLLCEKYKEVGALLNSVDKNNTENNAESKIKFIVAHIKDQLQTASYFACGKGEVVRPEEALTSIKNSLSLYKVLKGDKFW